MFGSHQEQRRSIARKVLSGAAALVAVDGVGTLATVTANAATPNAIKIFNQAVLARACFDDSCRSGVPRGSKALCETAVVPVV